MRVVDSLVKGLKERRLVLFLGSAISMYHPTLMPPGGVVTEIIKTKLKNLDCFGRYQQGEYLKGIWKGPSFEGILALNPALDIDKNPYPIVSFLNALYSGQDFNLIHRQIAVILYKGLAKAVITTNYDTGIENAFRNLTGQLISVVYLARHQERLNRGKPFLFKIHGSVDGPPAELVYSLYHESRGLPDWKRNLLCELLRDKEVLFLGYSGYDFDICPLLLGDSDIHIKKVYWSLNVRDIEPSWQQLDECLSPEAKALLKKYPGKLCGDLRLVLSHIFDQLPELHNTYSKDGLEGSVRLKENLCKRAEIAFYEYFKNEDELRLWLLAVLCRMGLGADALENAAYLLKNWRGSTSIKPNRWAELAKRFGEAYFHLGKYINSEKWFRRATSYGLRAKIPPSQIIDCQLSSIEAARCQLDTLHYLQALLRRLLVAWIRLTLLAPGMSLDEKVRTRAKLLERLGQLFQEVERALCGASKLWVSKILKQATCCKMALYRRALRRYRAAGDEFSASDVEYRMARREVRERYERVGYALGKTNQLRSEARRALQESNLTNAEELIRQSISLAELLRDWPGLAKGYYILSEVLAKRGERTASLAAYAKAVTALSELEVRRQKSDYVLLQHLSLR
jgi:tetratricopeptide (TPR) repeat protein